MDELEDWSDFDGVVETAEPANNTDKKFEKELYKKWFKAGNQSGFISITPWYSAAKAAIDIGSVNPDTKAVKSSTKCFVSMVDFAVYLRAIVNCQAETLYPKRDQCPSPESYVSYGASGDLSRVFKVHYWGAGSDSEGDPRAFAFKCGHFGGKVTQSGATIPDFKDRKSADMIKISRLELHEISYRLDLAMIRYAVTNPEGILE